jgi:hypothetical protein
MHDPKLDELLDELELTSAACEYAKDNSPHVALVKARQNLYHYIGVLSDDRNRLLLALRAARQAISELSALAGKIARDALAVTSRWDN